MRLWRAAVLAPGHCIPSGRLQAAEGPAPSDARTETPPFSAEAPTPNGCWPSSAPKAARERDELRADPAGASRTSRARSRHPFRDKLPAPATRLPETARPAQQPRGSALAARPGNRSDTRQRRPGRSGNQRRRGLPMPPVPGCLPAGCRRQTLDSPAAAYARRGVARPRKAWSGARSNHQPVGRLGPGYCALAARSTIFAACPAPALSTIRDLGRARSSGVSHPTAPR